MGKQITLSWTLEPEQLSHDVYGLPREWDDIRWDIAAFFAQANLQLLHDDGRDGPDPSFKVELLRHRGAQLARSHACQE